MTRRETESGGHMSGESYFLYHSIGQYPGKARDLAGAMAEFALSWGTADDGQWAYALPKELSFRSDL